jgi:hypothetical protein
MIEKLFNWLGYEKKKPVKKRQPRKRGPAVKAKRYRGKK